MKNMTRAEELHYRLRTWTYTNDEFWEALDLLNATPSWDWTPDHDRLQALWTYVEAARIDAGIHRGPDAA